MAVEHLHESISQVYVSRHGQINVLTTIELCLTRNITRIDRRTTWMNSASIVHENIL